MADKITIKICTGTTCYVLGGALNLELEKEIPLELLLGVSIEYSPCLGLCQNADIGKAPFVKVADQIVSEATPEKVIDCIKKVVAKNEV